ncbi:hypothetical protein BDV29DRAFT_49024 [Aspergillus leporis]|uniref:Uncharacterized protein n=1 Tax=Aspergillus leporis TaxID=41062 RepID=A0A5N5XBS7_9EURO|nr:hypothetical protein BDV29DRAFT_49024 [Aspergillus leporis]
MGYTLSILCAIRFVFASIPCLHLIIFGRIHRVTIELATFGGFVVFTMLFVFIETTE